MLSTEHIMKDTCGGAETGASNIKIQDPRSKKELRSIYYFRATYSFREKSSRGQEGETQHINTIITQDRKMESMDRSFEYSQHNYPQRDHGEETETEASGQWRSEVSGRGRSMSESDMRSRSREPLSR